MNLSDSEWNRLYVRLWADIQRHEGRIVRDTAAFLRQFITAVRADGYAVDADTERALSEYLAETVGSVRAAVEEAIRPLIEAAAQPGMLAAAQDAEVMKAAEAAFSRRWPDGLTLSDRVWRWQQETRRSVTDVLREGVAANRSSSKLIYDLQYAIEHGNKPFSIVADDAAKWIELVRDWGKQAAQSPDGRKLWREKQLPLIERYIDTLKVTGTKRAMERALTQMRDAIEQGSTELIDDAIKWMIYDRQLYDIKRVVRTEMSTAQHNAVIDTTIQDATILGYQWRLSSAHPEPDICDFYAAVDYGMGRGVFPKEQVPRGKAHPHCLCVLIPRVTRERKRGDADYLSFTRNAPRRVREAVMPEWARRLDSLGFPLERVLRPDRMGLVKMYEARALIQQQWPEYAAAVQDRPSYRGIFFSEAA